MDKKQKEALVLALLEKGTTYREIAKAGAIAGTFLSLINQVMVEPFIDEAIEIETQNMIDL
ncbi:MAG: hypothetical protein ACRD5J_17690 [Nitrososphaeraceae archaeon]